jgi:hypothetical protein
VIERAHERYKLNAVVHFRGGRIANMSRPPNTPTVRLPPCRLPDYRTAYPGKRSLDWILRLRDAINKQSQPPNGVRSLLPSEPSGGAFLSSLKCFSAAGLSFPLKDQYAESCRAR